jgi:putative DNA methylase
MNRPRLLIEEWLPTAELGIESVRERTPLTPFPAPNRLHVWWARRPLVACRAAILGSLLPADADREKFMHVLGIHGDPLTASRAIEEARRTGERVENPYEYDRAFQYKPDHEELQWLLSEVSRRSGPTPIVLDPTAGGGAIPFETIRLGLPAVANELNPVAWLVLKGTVEFPAKFGARVLDRYRELAEKWLARIKERVGPLFPQPPEQNRAETTLLWARTITCPYCGGVVPLSPNWVLSGDGTGVRLLPDFSDPAERRIRFEIVHSVREHGKPTVTGGTATCPFPDCGRVINGEEIKEQARAGRMGQQLYAVIFKEEKVVGYTKAGKPKKKLVRGFRAPRPEDDVEALVRVKLAEKMPDWQARNIVPDEEVPAGTKTDEARRFGMYRWADMFSPRQLYGHCTSVEVFQELVEEIRANNSGSIPDLDRAALTYLALALDKMLNYNAYQVRWHSNREVLAGVFDRHDFSFKWSYAEMAPTVTGVGYDWAIEQTGKALKELIELVGHDDGKPGNLFQEGTGLPAIELHCTSADRLPLAAESVDLIVMDPPYYQNVMYAELADFFYVWLKRTAGLLYPEQFAAYLTDKDREAVANPARFAGQRGAQELAARDYENRMAAIFAECRRVLKPNGVMTVMFTHKSTDAWDALAAGLISAGFVITASWPVRTESEGSLHIKEKSAAQSTIFLVCRVREERASKDEVRYWEDVEPQVADTVRKWLPRFQADGLRGVDLYLACFGPALQVFSENWPLTRGRARPEDPRRKQVSFLPADDPYAVRPEDALLAARREVKNWRMAQLATVKRQHHLDPLTEWFVLAWDAFRAPRFPSDEALKLARVVGLNFDGQIRNVVCETKGEDVILWDSKTRRLKGSLGHVSDECMLDALHHAALLAREQNTGVARDLLERANLLSDPTLLTALEALLNVLPPPSAAGRKAESSLSGATADFVALEKLRRLAFAQEVPAPKLPEQLLLAFEEGEI